MAVVRKGFPLLSKSALESAGAGQLALLKAAKAAVEALMALWSGGALSRASSRCCSALPKVNCLKYLMPCIHSHSQTLMKPRRVKIAMR